MRLRAKVRPPPNIAVRFLDPCDGFLARIEQRRQTAVEHDMLTLTVESILGMP
jgi:hypothetical protein